MKRRTCRTDGRSPTRRLAGIANTTRGTLLATEAAFALSRGARRRGLAGRVAMDAGEALILPRCRQVHSFGMLFDIDVLFLDRNGAVVRACPCMSPRRVSPVAWGASTAVELPSGTIAATRTRARDRVEFTLRGRDR